MSKTDSKEITQEGNGEDNRYYQRRSVLWPAKIRVNSHEITCQVWNLSLGGARVRIDLPIQTATDVTLYISGRGEFPATVSWNRGNAMGLSFRCSAAKIQEAFADRAHVLGLDEEAP